MQVGCVFLQIYASGLCLLANICKWVVSYCRYIDSRAENGLTALHLAALSGNLECVRLLLDSGASMMVRTVDLDIMSDVAAPAGSTPLHVAAMSGNVAILQAMLQVSLARMLLAENDMLTACHTSTPVTNITLG